MGGPYASQGLDIPRIEISLAVSRAVGIRVANARPIATAAMADPSLHFTAE